MYRILGILLAGLPVLAQAQQPRPDTVATRVQVRGADCALFPAAARWPLYQAPAPSGRFTPSIAQARAAERVLAGVSLRQLSPQPLSRQDARHADSITHHLRRYHRQYFGYYNRQRQPCLYINCLAEVAFEAGEVPGLVAAGAVKPPPPGYIPHWLRAAQAMGDGGWNYWWISYNLATGQFTDYGHDLDVGGG